MIIYINSFILCDFTYVTFWKKKQNYEDNKISGGEREGDRTQRLSER